MLPTIPLPEARSMRRSWISPSSICAIRTSGKEALIMSSVDILDDSLRRAARLSARPRPYQLRETSGIQNRGPEELGRDATSVDEGILSGSSQFAWSVEDRPATTPYVRPTRAPAAAP